MAKTKRELRKFGLTMVIPVALIGGYMWWNDYAAAVYLMGLAGLFLVAALTVPVALRPVEKVWMAFARIMSIIMTRVILSITYYLLLTPLGFAARLLGTNLMPLRPDEQEESYWSPVTSDGFGTDPDKPY